MAFFGNKVSIRLYFLSDFCVASPYCHCFRKHSIVPLEYCRFLFLHILSSVASRASRAMATVFDHTVLIDFVERHICAQFHTCTWKLIAWVARIPFCVQTLYLRIILIYPVAFYSMGWCAKLCGWMSVFFSMSSYFFLFSSLISIWFLFIYCCIFSFCMFVYSFVFVVFFVVVVILLFVRLNAVCNIRSCLQAFHFRDDIALVIILSRMHDCVQKTSSTNWLQIFIETENY